MEIKFVETRKVKDNNTNYLYFIEIGTRSELASLALKSGATLYDMGYSRDRFPGPGMSANVPLNALVSNGYDEVVNRYFITDKMLMTGIVDTEPDTYAFRWRESLSDIKDYITDLEGQLNAGRSQLEIESTNMLAAIRMVEWIREVGRLGSKKLILEDNPGRERFQYIELK